MCGVFYVFSPLHASILIPGDGGNNKTFSFALGPVITAHFEGGLQLMAGAGERKTGNIYALSSFSYSLQQFAPLAAAPLILDNAQSTINPLCGQQIRCLCEHLSVEGVSHPFAVVDAHGVAQRERLFWVAQAGAERTKKGAIQMDINIAQSAVPADAGGNAAQEIGAIASGAVSDEAGTRETVWGAVSALGQPFGTGLSGICMAQAEKKTTTVQVNADEQKHTSEYFLKLFDAQTGAVGNRAALFNTSIDAIKIGAQPMMEVLQGPVVDMWWDRLLGRLYLAVRVTSAGGALDGARAVVVGRVQAGVLRFEKIVPDAAILQSSNTRIIGACNGASASIYKVRTMHTTTGLTYLIVNGGNGQLGEVANRVYALPLVSKSSGAHALGVLANAKVAPDTAFMDISRRFKFRAFTQAAQSAQDMVSESDSAAMVGGGALPFITSGAGVRVLTDLHVFGDVVYACVPYDYANVGGQSQQPGIFQSRAVFDQYGRITAWTPWIRVSGNAELIKYAFLDARRGDFWFAPVINGVVNTIKKTVWGSDVRDGLLGGTTSDADVGLVTVLGKLFGAFGGVQAFGVFDQFFNSVGVPHAGLSDTTTLLAAGKGAFALVKTGDSDGVSGTIRPYVGDFRTGMAIGERGMFPDGHGRVFAVSGGALDIVGPPTTVTTFSSPSGRSWIAVGGVNGVAVLSDANGNGFEPNRLPAGFTFKPFGAYRYVKKIVGDDHFLYILTMTGLERVVIDPATFVSGVARSTPVATCDLLGLGCAGSFSDVIIGNNLALVGTNKGVYRIANGQSIKVGCPSWVPVSFNQSPGPVCSLSLVLSAQDVVAGLVRGSQVLALVSYTGFEQAVVFRLFVKEDDQVTDNSVQMIGDLYVENLLTYFASFGQFRGAYADDGAFRLAVRPLNLPRPTALFALPPLHVAERYFPTSKSLKLGADYSDTCWMGTPVRSSASGAWLLLGDFGLRVNE